MAKYKQFYDEMVANNKDLFDHFKQLHDRYAQDKETWRDQFNTEGAKVQDIIRRYENRLCGRSENSGYGSYTSTLADKFWGEVRKTYPMIDFVGTK